MNLSIDLSLLFQKSIALFKAYFQIFVLFGAISAVLGTIIQFIPDSSDYVIIFKSLLTIILALVQIRVTISIILIINSRLIGETLDASEALKESGAFFSAYFITSVLLALRLLAIALPLIILVSIMQNMVAYIIAGILGGIGFLYLFIHYSFAPIMRVLNPEVDTPFATSYAITKKYRLEIFLVFFSSGSVNCIGKLNFYVCSSPLSYK